MVDIQVTSVYPLTKEMGAVIVGMVPDSRFQAKRAKYEASGFAYREGYPMPVGELAQRVADVSQYYTQARFIF